MVQACGIFIIIIIFADTSFSGQILGLQCFSRGETFAKEQGSIEEKESDCIDTWNHARCLTAGVMPMCFNPCLNVILIVYFLMDSFKYD